jgi:cytochrome b561
MTRYSTVSITLHWLIAALLVAQIFFIYGRGMVDAGLASQFMPLHKALGVTILMLTVLRVIWRLVHPFKPLASAMPVWQKAIARVTHVGFYLVLIMLPMTGWVASSAALRPFTWFGLFNWPLLPVDEDRGFARQAMGLHDSLALMLYVLLALHAAGVLKHYFIDRDNVLARMLPFLPNR